MSSTGFGAASGETSTKLLGCEDGIGKQLRKAARLRCRGVLLPVSQYQTAWRLPPSALRDFIEVQARAFPG